MKAGQIIVCSRVEALGLKWGDLDYERQMIHLRRVWVGNDVIDQMKTDGSAAPALLGELLADERRQSAIPQSRHRLGRRTT